MENLDGKITLMVNREYTTIKIDDEKSGQTICVVTLTPEQLSSALSRLALTSCKINYVTDNIDRLGKEHEVSSFNFVIKQEGRPTDEEIYDTACELVPDGWAVRKYFGSQNQVRYDHKIKSYVVRANIERWVNP